MPDDKKLTPVIAQVPPLQAVPPVPQVPVVPAVPVPPAPAEAKLPPSAKLSQVRGVQGVVVGTGQVIPAVPPKPTLGRVVIFTDTDGKKYAATVAEVAEMRPDEPDADLAHLQVSYPLLAGPHGGLGCVVFKHAIPRDDSGKPGTWAWPARS